MSSEASLRSTLRQIDGRSYRTYKELRGRYEFEGCTLFVDSVQGDPFAAPSRVRVRVAMERTRLPGDLYDRAIRRLALGDFLARRVRAGIPHAAGRRRGSGKSGQIFIDAGGQEVLERTALVLAEDFVEARLQVGLPAAGRRVLGREAEELLCDDLPRLATDSLIWEALDEAETRRFVDCVENQEHLRDQLQINGLVAFVANGAVLPRESGASDRPLSGPGVVPFCSPDSLRVELGLVRPIDGPDGPIQALTGMGIPRGVTLVAGGGYHGKSTLLRALERAVYPHVPGDGREWVVSDPGLVKIRAEDGRRVESVDISAFIGELPQGRSTLSFSSDDASGSTSQATNIVEAAEAGATGLLLDEDTCATNFMVRDARMQALVHDRDEPITPFVERVRELYERHGVSTVLVMGGCGDYFDVADHVLVLRDFQPRDATAEARHIAAQHASERSAGARSPFDGVAERIPQAGSFDASRGRRDVKIEARGVDRISYGRIDLELRGVEQLVDVSQTRAVGHAIHLSAERFMGPGTTLAIVLDRLENFFDSQGLDELDPFHRAEQHPGNFARPRRFEVAAAINRLRSLRMQQA